MLYTVAVAVCLAAVPIQDCQQSTATAWLIFPEESVTMGDCMRNGMFFAASSRLVPNGAYPKVFCSVGGAEGNRVARMP